MKKRIIKKITAILLVVLMLLTSVPVSQLADVDWSDFSIKASASYNPGDSGTFNTYMADMILNNYNGIAKVGDTTFPHLRYKRFTNLELATVAKPVVEEINSNAAFRISEAAWEVATFSLSDVLSKEEEQIEYYETILLTLVNAMTSYSLIPSTLVSYEKNTAKLCKEIAELKKIDIETASSVNLWNCQLSAEDANEIYQNFAKEEWKVESRIQDYKGFLVYLNAYSDAKSFVEDMATYIACVDLSDNIISVLNELYNHCSNTNIELKTAIFKVKEVSKNILNGIAFKAIDIASSNIQLALDNLWEGILNTLVGDLSISILAGQTIGKIAANILFSTDKVIEQWYKMNAFVTIERALVDSINSLGNKYINSHSDEDAQVFIASLKLLAEVYTQDYDMSEDLGEYLYEKGLWNGIKKFTAKVFGKYDSSELDEFHSNIDYLKSSVSDLTAILSQDYYQNFYEIDNNLSQTATNNIDLKTGKIISVACPTDVDVYDSAGNLCLSVKSNEVIVSSFDNFIIVDDETKSFFLNSDDDYSVVITGTDTGKMDYNVCEISNNKVLRTVSYYDVELEKDKKFSSEITPQLIEPIAQYNLKTESGEIIEADYDSLPPVEDNITDVIVAEELFDGFSTELIDKVADTMFNFKTSVDISSYQISTDEIVALFSAVAKYYPTEYSILSKTNFSYRASISPSLGIVTKLRFFYDDDVKLSDFQRQTQECNAEISKLVANMEGMTDFEKALYVHDYILLNSEYDLELLDIMEQSGGKLSGELHAERYSEYSILVNGTGVCGSYALAYRAVLNAAGVECLYLSSAQMNHAWNLIKLDGKWYHVDVCWDDPVPDTYGRARRTYFLRTDEEIMNLSHYSWTPGQYKATSTKYSDMPRNYDVTQKYDNSSDLWYYLSGTTLYTCNQYGEDETEIGKINASSLSVDNGDIYYASGRYVYEYNSADKTSDIAYFLKANKSGSVPGSAYFTNIYVSGDEIDYYKSIYDNENKRTVIHEKANLEKEIYASITGIELNQTQLNVDVFDTYKLNATILSTGPTDGMEVVWNSSNDTVATVSSDGAVKCNNVGTAEITVSVLGYSAKCTVTVTGDGLSGTCGASLRWSFDVLNKHLSITGTGKMSDFSYNSQPWEKLKTSIKTISVSSGITSVGAYAFYYCTGLIGITIPNGVTSIGDLAFYGCSSLTSITIPNSVTSIGDSTFYGCSSLTSITIPDRVTSIGSTAFCYCSSLTSATIGNCVARIGSFAFRYCMNLTAITIPGSVTSIERSAFSCCPSLTSISVKSGNTVYDSRNGCNAIIKTDNNTLIVGCKNTVIPNSVTSIGDSAFDSCSNLTSITIPDSVTSIGTSAFDCCRSLTSVIIGNKVKSIGIYAFRICSSLTSVTIPDSVTSIDSAAFYGCSGLTSITIPDSVTSIGGDAFFDCSSLTSVTIPDSVTSIYSGTFRNCSSLTSVTIPDSVTSIGWRAFEGCSSLTSITIPDSVTSIGDSAFEDCSNLISATIGSRVINIGLYAFRNCSSLTGITIPNSVTKIDSAAFEGCSSLASITIPCSVTSIGNHIFSYCRSLTSITVESGNTVYDSRNDCNAIIETDNNTLIVGCKNTVIPNSVTSIDDWAFYGCSSLTSITIPDSVTSIGNYAFNYCTGLTSITVESGNTVYDSRNDCNAIIETDNNTLIVGCKNTIIPNSVTSIDGWAFFGCGSLTSITIPDSVTSIGDAAFYGCNAEYIRAYCDISQLTKNIKNFNSLKKILITDTENAVSVPTGATVYAHGGSTMDTYCADNGIPFVNIDDPHGDEHDYFLIDCKLATEVEDGLEIWWCYCGESEYTNVLHKFSEETTTDPTCVEDGKTTRTCLNCGYVETVDTIKCTGKHTYELIEKIPGNCSTDGYEKYKCSVCGGEYTKTVSSDDSHNMVETVVAPTCTTKGYTLAECSLCGATEMYDFTAPTGHKLAITKSSDNCSAHGILTYSCSKCDYTENVAIDDTVIETETVIEVPTCTTPGTEKEVCVLCGATVSTEILATKGHIYADEYTVDVKPTCIEKGSQSRHCTECEAKAYVTDIPAKGHTPAEAVQENVVKATCKAGGSYDRVVYCSECNTELSRETVKTDILRHTSANAVKEKSVPATCIRDGSYDSVIYCRVCGVELSRELVTVNKTGHNYKNGYCINCGEKDPEYIPTCSHMCHKSGFVGFIWKIINLFNKLFKINQYCECGAKHW